MNPTSSFPTSGEGRQRSTIIFIIFISAALYLNNLFCLTVPSDDSEGGISSLKTDVAMPPSLTLITVALGPLRGLIVDALWWKVVDLQEESNYFEILPITEWITAMEPRNPYVWTFHAWNLAYNISSSFPTADARWKWIYNGIKLLRDDARKFNPNSKFIQSELALLISDKITSLSDPDRDYIIKRWIKTKEPFFESGLRDDLRHMIAADTPEYAARAKALREKMGMDPKRMLRLDIELGPLQWKLPQASSIYWGFRKSDKTYSQGDLNYRAVTNVAMSQAFLYGSYIMNPKNGRYVTSNNLDIAPNIIKLFKIEMKEGGDSKLLAHGQTDEFIRYAAPIAYAFDRPDIAAKLYSELQSNYPKSTPPFDKFISQNLIRLMDSAIPRLHQSLVEISLYNAYKAFARGDNVSAVRFAESAKRRWDEHMRLFGGAGTRFTIPPFENIKMAAYARTLRHLNSSDARRNFVKRVGGIRKDLLRLPDNDAIIDYSVSRTNN